MSKNSLDGSRVRSYLGAEVAALLATYDQFAQLLPSRETSGAAHRGEDGRYVESLVRQYLGKLLPSSLEVSSGFILRPAVKTGLNGRERRGETDTHSTQLDVIVHDSSRYPVFQRFGDSVIVPPEAVIAIVSVKKALSGSDITAECRALQRAAQLCECIDSQDAPQRGPYLALLAVHARGVPKTRSLGRWIYDRIEATYADSAVRPSFDELVGLVATLDQVCVFKRRPIGNPVEDGRYLCIDHRENEKHWTLQLILTGILSVYYDPTRGGPRRPGFSGFERGRKHDGDLGAIAVAGLRYVRHGKTRVAV